MEHRLDDRFVTAANLDVSGYCPVGAERDYSQKGVIVIRIGQHLFDWLPGCRRFLPERIVPLIVTTEPGCRDETDWLTQYIEDLNCEAVVGDLVEVICDQRITVIDSICHFVGRCLNQRKRVLEEVDSKKGPTDCERGDRGQQERGGIEDGKAEADCHQARAERMTKPIPRTVWIRRSRPGSSILRRR